MSATSAAAEETVVKYEEDSSSLFRIVKTVLKNFVTVSTIYLFGYFDLSVAWLIAPIVLGAFRTEWKKVRDRKRKAVQEAVRNEKKVILSTLGDLPSWVFFPDMERAEWINKMLIQLWPNINTYAQTLIKTTVEPKLQETLVNYKISGFKFVKLRFGTIPPRIGGIKVYDKMSRNEIMMDIDLLYAGDCDISFSLKGVSGGIKDFQIHGMMRIVMKPLIPCVPFVGGVQVFFLNKPHIDFDLVGAADILDIPGISDVLRKVIVEQISNLMVLPNKFPVVLSETIPAQIVKTPEPEGVLRVQIVQAIKLMKKDIGMLGKGKSDPYVIVTLGAQEFRSKTIDNTVNPKWDFWCESIVTCPTFETLKLDVWDWDPGLTGDGKDDFLGRTSLKLQSVLENGEIDQWISLEDVKHGMIHVRMMWYNLSKEKSDLDLALNELKTLRVSDIGSTVLILYLDSIQHLPDARANKRPDPVTTITAGHETKNLGVQFRTTSPVYEQGFTFLIHNPKTDSFTIRVTDQKTGSELGVFIYQLSSLYEKYDMKHDIEPFRLTKSGSESKVLFAAQLKILKKSECKRAFDPNPLPPPITPPSTPSKASTEILLPDGLTDGKSLDETSRDVKSITNEDSVSNDIKSLSSASGIEDEVNVDAYKSEEVSNSCKWLADQLDTPKQNNSMTRQSSIASSAKGSLRKRRPSQSESIRSLGSIEITLNFMESRQKLLVTIHRIVDLPVKDPTDLPDPYVKVYMLPKNKDTKRKTKVVKDSSNPVYDETFEYVLSKDEIPYRQLRVTVTSLKTSFISKSSGMGHVLFDLKEVNLNNYRSWYQLEPDTD